MISIIYGDQMDDVERSENYIRRLIDASNHLSGNKHIEVGEEKWVGYRSAYSSCGPHAWAPFANAVRQRFGRSKVKYSRNFRQ